MGSGSILGRQCIVMTDQISSGLGIQTVIGDKREQVLKIAEKHGAYNVRVFGSVARGEATPESDVDLIAQFQDGVSIFDLVGMWLDLQDLLGIEVNLIADHPSGGRITEIAREEAVPL